MQKEEKRKGVLPRGKTAGRPRGSPLVRAIPGEMRAGARLR